MRRKQRMKCRGENRREEKGREEIRREEKKERREIQIIH